VKHRSPLFTLAGLVLAFAIMFGVNLANSAPRVYNGTEPAATIAAASTSSLPATTAEPVTGDQDA
jgi:hypothetical protein